MSDTEAIPTSAHEILRPRDLAEFVGQEGLKDRLRPWIAEARETTKPMPHLLLTSESGMGKTSLAEVIANELGDPFTVIDLSRMTDKQFVSFMRRFEGGVLFVDELHRARPAQQEELLTLMWEGYIATSYGGRIEIPWVTVIAATTEKHKLVPAVVGRFALRLEYELYGDQDMSYIVAGMADRLDTKIDDESITHLALASGGVPRAASELVRAWRALGFDGEPSVERVLYLTNREPDGLTSEHLTYLRTLDQLEGHAGERPLANVMRVHPSHLQSLERLLIHRGLITLTPQGRALTARGDRRLRGDKADRTIRRL